MELLECRFRPGRAAGEAIFAVVFSFIAAAPLAGTDPRLSEFPALLLPGGALSAIVLLLLAWRRWRSRIRLDERGVEWRRSERRVVARLEWGEIEEFFLLGGAGFELRGAGRRIHFSELHEGIDAARDLCLPRLSGMRDLLRARALREGRIVFRMPGGRWKAHLAYVGAVLILTGVTWYCVATLLDRKIRGLPFFLLFFGGSWLWSLRKRASGLGTRLMLLREGLVVRRLDGKDRVAWEDLARTQWNDRGGLDLVLRSGRVISLPSTLGNIGLLEEFLREGRQSVDSEAQGPRGGRTMMQSP